MTIPAPPSLTGRSVRLRPPGRDDLLRLFDWYNDPEAVAPFDRFTLDRFDTFVAAIETAHDDPRSLAPRFVVERSSDGKLLGFVGHYAPHPVLETTDIWYALGDREERGKGYGAEAVRQLVDHLFSSTATERVGATCDVENVPSYRLLERRGFRLEGTMRSALFHHGRWHDVRIYGLTRPEWAGSSEREKTTRAAAPG